MIRKAVDFVLGLLAEPWCRVILVATVSMGWFWLMTIPEVRDLVVMVLVIPFFGLAVYGWLLIAQDIKHDRL